MNLHSSNEVVIKQSKELNRSRSIELFEKAKHLFPGGVNSPVRAFKAVDGSPLFIARGDKAYLWDEDGNAFIDFCCSWGPLILGHNNGNIRKAVANQLKNGLSYGAPTLLENTLAEMIINNVCHVEKLRFVSSGTEALMSAIRLARAYTKRDKIVKFEGCYHGHSDSLLVKAGSGLVTLGETSSAGVPASFAQETIVIGLDDRAAVETVFRVYGHEIAAVIIEGVPANNGLLIQEESYIHFLRDITKQYKSILIFDEVITGFRLGIGGAAAYYNVKPDIVAYGKIIGGGMPVGAYGGSNELMSMISPDGPVYQAGTLSGNPIAMTAGIATLQQLLEPRFYERLASKTMTMVRPLRDYIAKKGYPVELFSLGSMFWFSFSSQKIIRKATDIDPSTMQMHILFHKILLCNGVYFGPSGYEVGFISTAHTVADLKYAVDVIKYALDQIFEEPLDSNSSVVNVNNLRK